MRNLYLFLTFLLAVTCIFALMAASADLYDGYEQQARLERLRSTGEAFPAMVVEKRLPERGQPASAASGSISVELRAGPRQGEVIPVPADAGTFTAVSEGALVTVLVSPEGAALLDPDGREGGGGMALAIGLLSLAGTIVFARRIRRMPARGADGDTAEE